MREKNKCTGMSAGPKETLAIAEMNSFFSKGKLVFPLFHLVWLSCLMAGGCRHCVGSPQPVQVREKWSKISPRALVVSIVLRGTPPKTEGHKVVRGPGEVIATVVLCRNINIEDHETPCCEAVALQQDRVHCCPEPHTEQLPARKILRDQAERMVVLVVHGMESAVQPGNSMVQEVPEVVLEIKDDHTAQDTQEKTPESRCFRGQRGWWPPQPLCHSSREDEKQMVVHSDAQGIPDVRPGYGSVLVQPVTTNAGPGGSQQVQHGVNTNQDKVCSD